PLTIDSVSPTSGSSDVGVTQRPRIDFSRPVNPASLTSARLYLSFSGQTIPATIVPSADDTFVWLFPSQPMPGASLITLTIDGGSNASPGIRTASGQLLDADGDGTPGGRTTITFTTVGNAAVPNT